MRARAAGVPAVHAAAGHGVAVTAAVVAGRGRAVVPSAAVVAAGLVPRVGRRARVVPVQWVEQRHAAAWWLVAAP